MNFVGRLHRSLIWVVLLAFPILSAISPAFPNRFEAELPQDTWLAEDAYGYQMFELSPLPSFIDIAPPGGAGSSVGFINLDDGLSSMISIGFPFPFYDSSYASLYIDTNGAVYFTPQNGSHFNNHPLPLPTEPNTLLAPLWGDLSIISAHPITYTAGSVYTYFYDAADPADEYFVIEWKGVYPAYTDLAMTFELVLYPDGDIRYHYLDLPSNLVNCVIGIENQSGSDGLMYWDGSTPWGAPAERALYFEYPVPAERVSVDPMIQGGFTPRQGASFHYTLTNNGNSVLPTSSYTIRPLPSDLSWSAELFTADGIPLPDAGNDGKFETGPIAKGGSLEFEVRLTPPYPLTAGSYLQLELRTALLDESKVVTPTLQSAVPLPFTQIYLQPPGGVMVEGFWKEGSFASQVSSDISSGSSPSIGRTSAGQYAAAWSKPCNTGGCPGSTNANFDISIGLVNGGLPQILTSTLVSDSGIWAANPTYSSYVFDPLLASTPNGRTAAVWRHFVQDETPPQKFNSNIEFSLIDSSGDLLISSPVTVTQDSVWADEPRYFHPDDRGIREQPFPGFLARGI